MRFVMPGFMPGIHVLCRRKGVDGRDKPGHDDPYAIALTPPAGVRRRGPAHDRTQALARAEAIPPGAFAFLSEPRAHRLPAGPPCRSSGDACTSLSSGERLC
jgi:hypothetical protein